jgi:hypothetical protein
MIGYLTAFRLDSDTSEVITRSKDNIKMDHVWAGILLHANSSSGSPDPKSSYGCSCNDVVIVSRCEGLNVV